MNGSVVFLLRLTIWLVINVSWSIAVASFGASPAIAFILGMPVGAASLALVANMDFDHA